MADTTIRFPDADKLARRHRHRIQRCVLCDECKGLRVHRTILVTLLSLSALTVEATSRPPIPGGAVRCKLDMIADFRGTGSDTDILLQATNESGYRTGKYLAAYAFDALIRDMLSQRIHLLLVNELMLVHHSVAVAQDFQLESSHPAPAAENVPVSASIHLRLSDAVNTNSLRHLTVKERSSIIPVRRSTDLTNASITLSPVDFLKPKTKYTVQGSAQVHSRNGEDLEPFQLTFTTGSDEFHPGRRLHFEQFVFDETRSMTTVLFGPDRRLYAASAFGELVRWTLDESGRPINRRILEQDPRKSRQYIDLEWDPNSSADNLVLWVSYAERLFDRTDPRRYFTGTVARLTIVDDSVHKTEVVVTGLPHGRERQGGHDTLPHQPNGLCFHGGKLYQSVGSTSSSGGPSNWGVKEQPLSASVLEIDYQKIMTPIDVYPGTEFSPERPDSPIRIFATGVRNALEIVGHSNGRLYTAVNINDRAGPADGVPDAPQIPGDQNQLVRKTTPDHESLYILKRGAHYGFPNPSRSQFILSGGNPTAGIDPFEIVDYPVGTQPDQGFDSELMFPIWQWGGTSPNGMIEYRPRFPHPLTGSLMCCFYSAGDIAVMMPGTDGMPVAIETLRSTKGKLRFHGPLDLTQDPATGSLYIADFGTQNKFGENGSMVMLRPVSTK